MKGKGLGEYSVFKEPHRDSHANPYFVMEVYYRLLEMSRIKSRKNCEKATQDPGTKHRNPGHPREFDL